MFWSLTAYWWLSTSKLSCDQSETNKHHKASNIHHSPLFLQIGTSAENLREKVSVVQTRVQNCCIHRRKKCDQMLSCNMFCPARLSNTQEKIVAVSRFSELWWETTWLLVWLAWQYILLLCSTSGSASWVHYTKNRYTARSRQWLLLA